jgi:hypothetical protein
MDVQRFNAGFATITESKERRFRFEHRNDGGMTWQPIDAGLSVQEATMTENLNHFMDIKLTRSGTGALPP